MDSYPPIIQQIVDIIVPLVEPDKIILFGSYARGDYNERSDVDLLVLKRGLENEGETVDNIYYSFYDNKIRIDVDVIAMNHERYLKVKDDLGYIYGTIQKEGKTVYESV